MAELQPAAGLGDIPDALTPLPQPAPRGSRFRFTIGGMLWITGVAALIIAALFAFPPVISAAIAGLMSVCIPAMLVGCLIYGGSGWRAFAIGMLLPSALRIVSGVFAGTARLSGSRVMTGEIIRLQMQQQMLRSGSNAPFGSPTQGSNTFSYFGQLAETWDRFGHAYMTEETLFWGASAMAGLATLFVQQRFARAAQAATKRIGGLAS